MPEKCETLEELRWTPGLADCDLKMYLRAARSMAAFAGMCDGGSAEDGCLAASRDDTTINALQLLHESNYDTGKALQALVKSPVPKGIEKKWTEEEQKRFVKGLRLYGKNFFKIRKELLSHKETPDLVEYYYLWKKTPQAASARPHRRHRRCVLRRIRNNSTSNNSNNSNSNSQNKANVNNKEDGSSGSDDEVEHSDDSDSNANSDLTCSNCSVLSKELHQTGTDRSLLCNECRNYMKKHNKHRPLDEKEAKSSAAKSEDDSNLSNGKPNLRTRKGKEKGSKLELNRGNSKSSETSSPDGNEMNSIESSSNSSEPKPTNGSTATEADIKKCDISKKRHFSNLDPTVSIDDSEPTETVSQEDNDSEAKRTKLSNEDDLDEKSADEKEMSIKEEEDIEDQNIKGRLEDTKEEEPELEKVEAIPEEVELDAKSENSNLSGKGENIVAKCETEQGKEPSALDGAGGETEEKIVEDVKMETEPVVTESQDHDSKEPEEEEEEEEDVKMAIRKVEESLDREEKMEKVDNILLANLKVESPSSPKSPEDLTTSREKRADAVPCTSLHTPTSLSVTQTSVSSPAIKKEDPSVLNFSASSKVSPSSSPNPMLFPFSQTFPQMSPSLAPSASMAERYPYMMPPMNFPPSVAMNPDAISNSPKLPHNEKFEACGEHKLKEEPKSTEPTSIKSSSSSSKSSDATRNLPSPKTISSTAPTFSSLAPPFGASNPNDPFLMANPNFAASHLAAAGGDRLPFPNPLINYPPGFAPHLPGLPPFMNPWSQYATAARLPPGAFPSPYLPPSANPISSHSPHSHVSKSKSPISSQSSAHHSSPSHFSKVHESKDNFDRRDRDVYQPEDDEIDNNTFLHRGPSPEPKIEDSECHRSQSAIFLRHWNRGDHNSCARTDLTFKPVPESQLSRKREERARKAAEKEREDHKQKSQEKAAPLELKPSVNHGPPQSGPTHEPSHLMSPLGGRHTPRNFDTPALRQLSEYARPHSTFSPFSHPPQSMPHHMAPSNMPPLGLHGPNPSGASPIDQLTLAQYQMFKDAEEQKQKMAYLEKQKELEMKSRSAASSQHNANLPPTSSANTILDQHFLDMQRRMAGSSQALSNSPSMTNNPNTSSANGHPLGASPGAQLNPFLSMFPGGERAAQEQMQQMAAVMALQSDRNYADRLAMDPLLRLQMSLNPELHAAAGAAAAAAQQFHHPGLQLHPAHSSASTNAENAAATMQLANAAAAMGLSGASFDPALHGGHPLLQSGAYPSRPPSIMPRPELAAAQQASLFRTFEDQLSHQLNAQAALQQHEMQRQMFERERMMHLAASSQMPHAAQFQMQEEFLRQRERELKMRGFDERNGRPPM